MTPPAAAPPRPRGAADEAWAFVRRTLDDLTALVEADACDDRERLEGLRVLARVLALCSELSVDADPEAPHLFAMSTRQRQVGGPNPDGEYDLCTLGPGRAYRVSGDRGTVTYLGFQVMAGAGLQPRRQAAYLSDRDLPVDADGSFSFVLAPEDPGTGELWLPIPDDASAVVVRQYVCDRTREVLASYRISPLQPAGAPQPLADAVLAGQLTALGWTMLKLMTLHRTVLPELLSTPNTLVTAEAAALGSENTTPDNLYMLGSFDLGPDEALIFDIRPPKTRYWSVCLENVWHECLEPFRRTSSTTNARAVAGDDGTVRIVVAGRDPGVPNWLDTGGRRRGFVCLRWLDNPAAPPVTVTVRPVEEVRQ